MILQLDGVLKQPIASTTVLGKVIIHYRGNWEAILQVSAQISIMSALNSAPSEVFYLLLSGRNVGPIEKLYLQISVNSIRFQENMGVFELMT